MPTPIIYTLDGTGTEIPAINVALNTSEIIIQGTATANGNYAISHTGTPNLTTQINISYRGTLDITTNGATFSILGQSLNQNDLNRELEITARWTGAAWKVITKKDFKEAGIIEASHMSTNSVATAAIQDDAITTSKILDGAVTTPKIADDAVTAAKINADVAGLGLSQAISGALDVNVDNSTLEISTDTVQVKDLGITTGKINNLAVTSAKLADSSVTTAKILNDNVTTAKIADDNVTNAKLAEMPTLTVKANITGSTANPTDVSIATLQPYFAYQLYKENPSSPTANTVTGINAFAIGTSNTSSGIGGVTIGFNCTASNSGSVAIGNTAVSSGDKSLATVSGISSGDNSFSTNTSFSTGDNSFSCGSNTTSSSLASFSSGINSNAFRYASMSSSGGRNNSSQFSQKTTCFCRRNTTDGSAANLALDGTTGFNLISVNSLVRFKGTIVAVQHAGSSGTVGDSATFDFYGTIKNVAGTTSLVDSVLWMDNTGAISNTPAQSSQDAAAAAWAVAITADNTNDALQIEVTGEANKSIYWHCVLEFNEIKFAE